MKKNLLLFFALFLISKYSFALVDYTEEAPAVKAPSPIKRIAPPSQTSSASVSSSGRGSYAPSGMFELKAGYGVTNAHVGQKSGKLNITQIQAHFETSYNLWLDAAWSMASFDAQNQIASGKSQNGNPQIILGVNWLEFGGGADRANIDFLVGTNLSQKDSAFASSRNDKIVGVETAKRFSNFVFGLSYRVWLTGSSKSAEEVDIGNIQRLSATLGWMVSSDIRFAVEASSVTVGAGEGEKALAQKSSFGSVSPSLQLSLSPMVGLELGADFRSRRLQDEQMLAAKLWNLPGSYGTTVRAGLSFSL